MLLQLCVNRKCVDFDTLGVTSCPTDELGNVCSGNGVGIHNFQYILPPSIVFVFLFSIVTI